MTPVDSARADLEDLRRLVPPPRLVPLSPQDEDRLRAAIATRRHLEHERQHRARTRRRRSLTWAGPVLVATCLVAVVVLAATGLTSDRPARHGAPARPAAAPRLDVVADAGAVSVLDDMSAVALRSRAPAVRADQLVYVRSTVRSNEGALGEKVRLSRPHQRQVWLSQDPTPSGRQVGLIREFGQDWPIDQYGSRTPGLGRPTYAWLTTLPTDPDALLVELERQLPPGAGQGRDQQLFDAIGSLVSESLLPPRTAAALYRAVTRIPGVRVDGHATDAVGREGVGITRTDTRYHVRSEWVFRRGTDRLLGTRSFFTGPPQTRGQRDVLFGATAVLERGVVDRWGAVPGVSG